MGRVKFVKGLHIIWALTIAATASASASPDVPPRALSFAYRTTHPVFPLPQSAIASLRDPDGDGIDAIEAAAADIDESAPPEVGAKPRVPTQPALCRIVADVANANNLPVPFFANLIWAESSFNVKTISRAGAQGIAQFMPRTAVIYGLENPFEPIHAIKVSARFLVELREQFGNLGLAAAAYNAGPRRVTNWLAKRGSLPMETQRYVHKITGRSVEQWIGDENVARAEIEPMPARAPCIEVAEAVLEQTRVARVANLMRELAASLPPPGEETVQTAPGRGTGTMLASGDKAWRLAKLRPSVKDLRARTRMAEGKSAKPVKLEASASRKRGVVESFRKAKRPNKPRGPDVKVAAGVPSKTPEAAVPAKVANTESKPVARSDTGRERHKAMRRTRFAYSADNRLH
jgi:hypothetical protein